ncbi:MAG: ABC transporter permease subunit [Planctomycetes bacterium]|nr:ABC transporter permease subunit [Planctomycetota bacterium]
MQNLRILGLFARTQFLRSLAPRQSWLVYVFTLLPSFVALAIGLNARRIDAEGVAMHLSWFLFLQVVVPLVTLLAGQAVISREVDDRTITYLFSRPISRPAMFVGRALGALGFTALLLGAGALLLCYAASFAPQGLVPNPERFPLAPWSGDGVVLPILGAVLLGSLAYTLMFAALGVFTRHPMILGLLYTFAVEGFLSNLPGSNQALTVQYYLRSWIAAHGAQGWSKLEGFGLADFQSPAGVLLRLGLLAALALALGSWRIRRKEFVLSS